MNNLQDDGWDLSDLKYIELDERDRNTYGLRPGDLLFNRTNSKELVGKCAVFREPGDWVFASYLIRVRTDERRLDPQFAADFLSTRAGRLQIDRLSRQIIGMSNINAEEIRDILLPLPPLPEQRKLVAAMDRARGERRCKRAQADSLIDESDSTVLETLGLPSPPVDQRRIFAHSLSTLTAAGRVDPGYHRPVYKAVEAILAQSPYPLRTIAELCDGPVGGATPTKGDSEAYATSGVRFLRICNVRPNEFDLTDLNYIQTVVHEGDLSRSHLAAGDVLMTITGRVGTTAVVTPDLLPANINQHLVRLRVRGDACVPEYLAAYLNTSLGLAVSNRGVTGGTRIALDYGTILALPIPVPPPAIQEAVVGEIHRRRDAARRLRSEAEADWQAAKRSFEEQLLGPETP